MDDSGQNAFADDDKVLWRIKSLLRLIESLGYDLCPLNIIRNWTIRDQVIVINNNSPLIILSLVLITTTNALYYNNDTISYININIYCNEVKDNGCII